MRNESSLKPQDVLLLLKLITLLPGAFRGTDLAQSLSISQSEISHGLVRLVRSRLVASDRKDVLRGNAIEFLVHGVPYIFPASPGPVLRGLPTAHSAPPLVRRFVKSDEKYVWPWVEGKVRGHSIQPLYTSAPFAASQDPKLYELLALLDSMRIGRVREKQFAVMELDKRICSQQFKSRSADDESGRLSKEL